VPVICMISIRTLTNLVFDKKYVPAIRQKLY
jgi:hypothetical protein